jgi:nitrogen regulatory protein PII
VRTYTPSTKNIAGRFDEHTRDPVDNDDDKERGPGVVASTKMLSMMMNSDCVESCVHGVVAFIDYTKNCGDGVVFVDETKDVGFGVVKK